MAISYNGLWKVLIDKGMKSTMAKMTNGESVNLSVLERICEKLDCDFADLVNYKRTQEENSSACRSNSHFLSENKEE